MKKVIRKLSCLIGRHKYYTIMRLAYDQRKIGCKNCYKAWATHDGLGVILRWDGSFDELYATTRGIKNIPRI